MSGGAMADEFVILPGVEECGAISSAARDRALIVRRIEREDQSEAARMREYRPHVILIGGFLGAGKTTAALALGEWLGDQGIRPAFITNDQGSDLVDTRLLQFCGHAAEEIAGGCFCCRFDDLVDATRRLRGVLQPDVFVAEAVGSCTDLAATVAYPLRRILGDECTVAPLSVLVDPVRARRALGLDAGETFSDDVQYIYRKQLEEADLIVVTKCEIVARAALDELRGVLRREFPGADVLAISSRERIATDDWFRRIVFGEQQMRRAMAVDYGRYADGEARLGWLNAQVAASSAVAADGNALLELLVSDLHRRLCAHAAPVAHLKMTLQAGDAMAAINLVRNDAIPEPGLRMAGPIAHGAITVNLRAEAAPELLEKLLCESVAAVVGWQMIITRVEAFRPGRPEPSHRDSGEVMPPST
jgi:G3E family GTPase